MLALLKNYFASSSEERISFYSPDSLLGRRRLLPDKAGQASTLHQAHGIHNYRHLYPQHLFHPSLSDVSSSTLKRCEALEQSAFERHNYPCCHYATLIKQQNSILMLARNSTLRDGSELLELTYLVSFREVNTSIFQIVHSSLVKFKF